MADSVCLPSIAIHRSRTAAHGRKPKSAVRGCKLCAMPVGFERRRQGGAVDGWQGRKEGAAASRHYESTDEQTKSYT
eukprot:1783301-Prymnesium_polylepis.3